MSTENKTTAVNPLTALNNQLAKANNLREIVSVNFARDRFIKTYESISGRKDGSARYEREVLSLLEIAENIPDIKQCEPFSIIAALVKAGKTGLSFADGNRLYPIVRNSQQKDGSVKKVLTVEIGAHGKKEMLERMPEIKSVDEPVVVFVEDAFEYSPKMKQVTKHTQSFPVPTANKETVKAGYVTVTYKDKTSQDFVMSIAEIEIARSKSKMSNGGQLWNTHYGEAVKKSLLNRVFKVKHKYPSTDLMFEQYEPEEERTQDVQHEEVGKVNQEDIFSDAQTVDVEVVDEKPKVEKTKAPKKEKKVESEEDSFL